MYQTFIDDSHDKLRAEFELWKQRWHATAEPPMTAVDAQHAMHPCIQTYPSCCRCSSLYPSPLPRHKRSFSTLKRLKTYLRSSMEDEWLTSLSLIHVHAQTTPIEPVEVDDKFALTGPHKLNFLRYVVMFLSCFLFLYI